MDFKTFIQKELQGWRAPEIICLSIVLGIILFNYHIMHDSKIAVISAICGILYTVIAGKGKISCYFFGLIGSSFYAYLSFTNLLWGNFLLYFVYYIPMQILGILKWKSHLKEKTHEIYKTEAKNKILVILISIFLSALVSFILKLSGDSNPILDGITTALSIIGMYLTVKRCIEQWIIWTIVNFIATIMWLWIALNGAKTYSTVIMWGTYLILGIYFYICWKKELNNNT